MNKPRTIADVNRDQGQDMEKALGPIKEKEVGCTCDRLPQFDMDGSLFSGRCRWCEKHEAQMTEDYDGDWPPGAPVYR